VVLLRPDTLADAVAARAAHPGALALRGGTDVMVELNFGRADPEALLDLSRIAELGEWGEEDGGLRIGAGVTHARVAAELGARAPGLAAASRTVGSRQIRNRGTLGGNLGTASPSADGVCALHLLDAEVELAGRTGSRRLPVAEFVTGPKETALAADELIAAVHLPPADGPQVYAKLGARNAMVMGTCSLGLALLPRHKRLAVCAGGAGPTSTRAHAAEAFAAAALDWEGRRPLDTAARTRFAELVAEAADPVDDVRGTAAYRRHALRVLAGRCLDWAWEEYACA
jgi:CO/xanthine dehydrogenase FAD-binding subunit